MAWDPKTFEFYDAGEWWDVPPPEREPISAPINPLVSFIFGNQCESPIEATLAWQLVKRTPIGYEVLCQYAWKGWRMDFAILSTAKWEPAAFVECDGAAFHCTPDRIRNDRRKDAAAKHAGIHLFRFTGSEIYADPGKCAVTVWSGVRA